MKIKIEIDKENGEVECFEFQDEEKEKQRERHQEIWDKISKISLNISDKNHLKFKVFKDSREIIWGLVRNSEGLLIGISRPNRDFISVDANGYFYRPRDGRSGFQERLKFQGNSIFIQTNVLPWDFTEWESSEIYRIADEF